MGKIVALAFDANQAHAYQIYRGAAEYVSALKLEWNLIPLTHAFESTLIDLCRSRKLDAAIGSFISDEWVGGLTKDGIQVVNLFHFSHIRTAPCISVDDRKIGREAGEHFAEHGARSITYLGKGQTYQNHLREEGLRETAKSARFFKCEKRVPMAARIEAILKRPGPIGILCSSDQIAREVILLLKSAGLKIGKDALVAGIGDEAVESFFAGIDISSFQLPTNEIGRAAAETLHQLMDGKIQMPDSLEFSVEAKFFPRASTLPTRHARVATRAKRLVEEELENPDFDIALMARRLGTSRRSLEIATREEFGESPYKMLSRIRMEKADKLLRKGRLRISEIGQQCGYPEIHHFSAWFKKRSGLAPKTYRERCRPTPANVAAQPDNQWEANHP